LIGGETAQMPGFYQAGEYDVSGTIVGVVDQHKMLDGKSIRPGDAIIGIASSGLHTNGYSLARQILFDRMRLEPQSRLPELRGTVGEELLKVHVSYGPLVQRLLKTFNRRSNVVKGFAHITGGGFVDNLPRVLPSRCDAVIELGSWKILPIFEVLQKQGDVPAEEMYQVFNMGIGMVVFVAAEASERVLKAIEGQKHRVWPIGRVTTGKGRVRLQ
jgi:phosphoribosylformylglycinamidine cyclo-ligase